jgi:poly-gamma-glutamate capsule biosynthesis protein CapA/YwtB (metallophosphatase superfamily)
MATDPQLKILPVWFDDSLAASITTVIGPFSNTITIRRFMETDSADSAGTTALNIDDLGTEGSGTTAIADKSAAVLLENQANVVEANNTNAADGYRLAAGNLVKVAITQATAAIVGYQLQMEYVDGIG